MKLYENLTDYGSLSEPHPKDYVHSVVNVLVEACYSLPPPHVEFLLIKHHTIQFLLLYISLKAV